MAIAFVELLNETQEAAVKRTSGVTVQDRPLRTGSVRKLSSLPLWLRIVLVGIAQPLSIIFGGVVRIARLRSSSAYRLAANGKRRCSPKETSELAQRGRVGGRMVYASKSSLDKRE